jgi:outer membrane lipoprotein-sorting protein
LYWTYNCDEYTKAKNIRIIITLILVSFLVACSGGAAVKAKEEEQKIDSISTEMDQSL